jgi:hypothetical protein
MSTTVRKIQCSNMFSFLWLNIPIRAQATSFLRFLNHIQLDTYTHTRRTPLKEWSVRRKGRYLHNTQQTEGRTSMPSVGFQPAIPAIETIQTYALHRTATRLGSNKQRPEANFSTVFSVSLRH